MSEEKNMYVHNNPETTVTSQESGRQSPAGKKPGAPKVIGILLIVFGSLLIVSGIFGGIFTILAGNITSFLGGMGAMTQQPGGQIIMDMFKELQPLYRTQGMLKIAVGLISVLALAAGVGLVRYRETGRKAALLWAVIALGYLVVDSIINITVIIPASTEIMAKMMNSLGNIQGAQMPPMSSLAGLTSSWSITSIIIINCIMASLPIVTLALMTRPPVKESLTRQQ